MSTSFGGNNGDINSTHPFEFPFSFTGRVDCDAEEGAMCTNFFGISSPCSATNDNNYVFPSPDLTTAGLLSYFADEFDFDAQETVAILGAHSIGNAARVNSGFPGGRGWDNDQLHLDNNYYFQIVGNADDPGDAPGWDFVPVDNSDLAQVPDRFIWFRGRTNGVRNNGGDTNSDSNNGGENRDLQRVPPFMLSADIALVRDFSQNMRADGAISCTFNSGNTNACPFASTIGQAAEYQENNLLWLSDFRDAFTKMSQNGYTVAEVEEITLPTEPPIFVPACFSGENTVTLEGGKTIPIHDLQINDKVLVQGGSYASVYSFGHRNPTASTKFERLSTKTATIELTSDHMVLVGGIFVPVSTIQLGDLLSNGEAVSSVKTVTRQGVYAPFTTTGTIVVSKIVSSSFVSLQKDSAYLMIGSAVTLPISWQWMCHTFEFPHRLVANLIGEVYTKDGISMWAIAPKIATEWTLKQPAVVIAVILIPLVVALSLLSLVEQSWFVVAVALMMSIFLTRRIGKKIS